VGNSSDPVQLLLTDLPLALGGKGPSPSLIGKLEAARNEVDHLRDQFAQDAVDIIGESFRSSYLGADPLDAVTAWASCFDAASIDRRDDLRIVDRAVLRKAVEAVNGRFSPKSLANALSSILLQRSLDKWDDRTAAQFRSALRDARERIESAALDTEAPTAALRPIVQARVEELTRMLVKIDETEDGRVRGLQAAGRKR